MSNYIHPFITPALYVGQICFLAGCIASLFFRNRPGLPRKVSCLTSAAGSLFWVLAAWQGLHQPAQGTLFTIGFDWAWFWRIDTFSSLFLLVVSGAGVLASIYGWQYAREYDTTGGPVLGCAYNLFLLSLGLVLTADGVLPFLLSWEFMSISSLFMVGLDHQKPAVRQAAFIYGIITHGATALLTIAFLLLANLGGLNFANWQALQPAGAIYHLVFALFLIGFGSKAGLVPVHVWLPRAHPAAPSHVSALMSGVMVKVAIYGLLRAAFTWLDTPPPVWGGILLVLGIASALTGALYAMIDQDLKGVLAYSTIENIGLLTAGMGAAILLDSMDAGALALGFVLLHTISHATFKMLLFLGAGAVQGATHTRRLDRLGGLIHSMPQTAGVVLVGVLTIAAVPPLAGFASEWVLMQVLFSLANNGATVEMRAAGVLAMVALALTAGLVAAAMVRLFGVVFLGRARTADATHAGEPSKAMRLPMSVLAAGCVVVGLASRPLLAFTTRVAAQIIPQSMRDISAAPQSVPLNPGLPSVALLLIALLALTFLGVAALTRHYGGKSHAVRCSLPWGCGADLTPQMQYSALGLAEPARIIFRSILRLKSAVTQTHSSQSASVSRFQLAVPVPGEGMLYKPVRNLFVHFAERIRKVQAGSLQLYLAYMLATLLVLLLVVR